MQSKFGRDLPKTTKDLNCQSQTHLCRVFPTLNFSTMISHFLGYEIIDSGTFMKTLFTIAHSWNFIALVPIRSHYIQNKVLIGTGSQGCLLDSGVFIEQSLITIISLVSTIQWELPKTENKQRHSYRNEFSLM